MAAQAAGPGDTVVVRDGVYGHLNSVTQGDSNSAAEVSPVVLRNSGRPGAWITIRAGTYKWGATLDCELLCDAYINLYNASYIVIEDFIITRGYKEGIHSNDAAHHILLRGNQIEFIANRASSATTGLDGMYTNPNCHDFTIDGNIFHDIGRTNTSQLDHGLYLKGSNFTISNNIFYNISHGWSIQLADGLSNVMIVNNTFAFADAGGQPGQIVLWNNQTNLTIRNNIFYQPAGYAIYRYQSTVTGCSIDHNLAMGVSAMLANSSACAMSANQTGTDPRLANPSGTPPDFHLQAGSPAIGAGTPVAGLAADFDGVIRAAGLAPDLGACAFVSGAAH